MITAFELGIHLTKASAAKPMAPIKAPAAKVNQGTGKKLRGFAEKAIIPAGLLGAGAAAASNSDNSSPLGDEINSGIGRVRASK